MSLQKKYNVFRLTFPEFVYESYRYDVQSDGLHIAFRFRLNESLVFEPSVHIPARPFLNFDVPKELLNALTFNIGMIELVSYWKAYCPPVVRVKPHGLSARQVAFWKKVYFHGLGEFFYVNGIKATYDDFMAIEAEGEPLRPIAAPPAVERGNGSLVPVGGGKDSAVTLELLKEYAARHGMPAPLPVVMNPRGATVNSCKVAGYGDNGFVEIRRAIHPLLIELNAKGALNGHTPFSAMLAFYTLLAATLSGRGDIALSNENSANESTVMGSDVNHQYSKSLQFEDDFRHYVSEFISTSFNYYSFLRPLSELQIAMLFARYGQYHDVFRSCNAGSKQDIWCGRCAKCLFAFIILSPFLSPERLSRIFGRNLLDDESLRGFFSQLTGQEPTKPFECVGTVAEVNVALRMALDKWYGNERPSLLRGFEPGPYDCDLHAVAQRHNLDSNLLQFLKSHVS